ncbi:MAG: SDR family NAD(P)-dependent oxidoreductase [Phenylobacterium sp.]|nr:SDR family NAD(P)-dependent oxidoreductase [Phenylobacterium sp.]
MPLDTTRLRGLHDRFPTRRAVITGAGSGLGRALALELARHGWTLLLNDNAKSRLDDVVEQCRVAGARVLPALHDAADLDAYRPFAQRFLDEFGGVDLVFTCAGIGLGGSFLETEPAHLREIMEVNLLGTMWTAKTFLPSMVAARKGHLITIASAAAFHGLPRIAAYAATKAGIVQLSETLRSELAASGVDVTVKMTTFYTSNIAEYTRGPDADREKARSLVEMAPWSAEQVADELLLHVQRRRFYMVAPGQALFLWRFKRLAPERYLRLVPALFPKLEAKLIANAARRRVER